MARREVKPGDYFLAPLKGTQRELLMQAVRPGPAGQWYVRHPGLQSLRESYVLLSSCHRCSPSRAARILGVTGIDANTSSSKDTSEIAGANVSAGTSVLVERGEI